MIVEKKRLLFNFELSVTNYCHLSTNEHSFCFVLNVFLFVFVFCLFVVVVVVVYGVTKNLKQNEVQSARRESTQKGVN